MMTGAIRAILQAYAMQQARDEMIKAAPPERQSQLIERLRREDEEWRKHQQALEIANASRPRNFWGQ